MVGGIDMGVEVGDIRRRVGTKQTLAGTSKGKRRNDTVVYFFLTKE